jgi:transposase
MTRFKAGRPLKASVDPELMIRVLLVGYCFGIRSERRLCQEVHLNLAYRWFCRLHLEAASPDHSSFSKNRHGRSFLESALFRRLFEDVVAGAWQAGLASGEGFAIDAGVIEADGRGRKVDGKPTGWLETEKMTRLRMLITICHPAPHLPRRERGQRAIRPYRHQPRPPACRSYWTPSCLPLTRYFPGFPRFQSAIWYYVGWRNRARRGGAGAKRQLPGGIIAT